MKKVKSLLIPFSVAFLISFSLKASSMNLSSFLNFSFFIFPLFLLFFIILTRHKRNPILLKLLWFTISIQNFFYSIMAYESFKIENYTIFAYFFISMLVSLLLLYYTEKFRSNKTHLDESV
ncbi:MAG: hypothetical protein COW00_02950 [Bdellovibrio sp. CG12_big_fil_rev_8_21_14_0_65_39_13]|nr:MAG: hypothetical protein COW78_13480 [Bdellovibrio sp. CG22_combo_CG10-13_8_21_14_all_39_27]PIQ61741.1 MAG: hypothetical protein COW00_02950 [Bdellovibrio sp. CG12_big_fil_rev_8_21_14_0_65_39_13]PIR34889.1 MAG: hypothetical protein COV37_11550 [Bdellovibrio sp. CG11_big_fil_rev_8_21_14_0_20_39_38]PJB54268.1 MAG: hypothetical protein CO099_02510 [Bdellovibrio sp. CG_4_9_14_3_um_filter_39_7]